MRNIVVAHGVVSGHNVTRWHEPGEAKIQGNVLDTKIDYVALGHMHLRERVGINAHYSGSTERTSWSDELAQPGYALVTLGEPGDMPKVEYLDLPARPMVTLSPIDGLDRSARELAAMVIERAGGYGLPDAMMRVELQNTPRPLFREVDAIVRRETGENAWHIRLTSPGEGNGPGPAAGRGPTDLHLLTLFGKFVDDRVEAGDYEGSFASVFRERGKTVLERAISRVQEASAIEGAS
jgi:hypothetical protein